MKERLNLINNDNLIKIGKNWEFVFLEENESMISSPVSSYYFLIDDLSINLSLNFKWSLYGWFFFESLKLSLDDPDYFENLDFNNSLNPWIIEYKFDKILFFDSVKNISFKNFKELLEKDYKEYRYTQNSIVHFKLKLNASEFIIIQNELFPKLCEFFSE